MRQAALKHAKAGIRMNNTHQLSRNSGTPAFCSRNTPPSAIRIVPAIQPPCWAVVKDEPSGRSRVVILSLLYEFSRPWVTADVAARKSMVAVLRALQCA